MRPPRDGAGGAGSDDSQAGSERQPATSRCSKRLVTRAAGRGGEEAGSVTTAAKWSVGILFCVAESIATFFERSEVRLSYGVLPFMPQLVPRVRAGAGPRHKELVVFTALGGSIASNAGPP